MIAAVARHSPDARFVHVSSQAAIGPADAERGASIDIEPRPISAYGRSKAAAEQAVRTFGGQWAILRPPAIYGPRDSDVFEFFRMASRGLSAAPSGDRWLTIAHVADVVTAVLAVAAGNPFGGIYHVGAAAGMPMDVMLSNDCRRGRGASEARSFPVMGPQGGRSGRFCLESPGDEAPPPESGQGGRDLGEALGFGDSTQY